MIPGPTSSASSFSDAVAPPGRVFYSLTGHTRVSKLFLVAAGAAAQDLIIDALLLSPAGPSCATTMCFIADVGQNSVLFY